MTCNDVRYVTALYFSDELDARATSDFESHLDDCGACNREIEQQQRYDDSLRAALAGQPLDVIALRARVLKQIQITGGISRSLRPVYLSAMAAILLLAFTAGLYVVTRSKAVAVVYADAVDDHYEEVVQRAPLSGWRGTRADITALGQTELGESEVIEKLRPEGYQMTRARLCELAGEVYVHLEYQNTKGEVSIFIKRRGSNLPGATKAVVDGCAIHLESARGFEVAGFQSAQFTVLIVSDLPQSENLRLARDSAARLV